MAVVTDRRAVWGRVVDPVDVRRRGTVSGDGEHLPQAGPPDERFPSPTTLESARSSQRVSKPWAW